MAGTLFVVATPIGNLEDLSSRALRVLREASVIAAEDTRHTRHLLERFGLTTPTTSLHEHNERGKAGRLIEQLLAGDTVALVSDAGTPTISDPGFQLVQHARAAGVRVEPVPGPSAVMAALSVAGMRSDEFVFLGFPPSKGGPRNRWLERARSLAPLVPTLVFYEAPHRIVQTLADVEAVLGNVEVAVARELTKAFEEVKVGPISTVRQGLLAQGEFTVVVNIGQSTELTTTAGVIPSEAAATFGRLTEKEGLTRRQAITRLSKTYRLQARDVFDLLERAKNSGG